MKKLLLLTLNTFSATGGIEKVCRTAGKALHEISVGEGGEFAAYSMHDKKSQMLEAYFPKAVFRGFNGNKIKFVLGAVRKGRIADTVILSHINLLLVGWLIKMVSPKTKLILIAHGIEVWKPLAGLKKKMINSVDLFFAVSAFTGARLQNFLLIPSEKIKVLNNCLDPYMKKDSAPEKKKELRTMYGFSQDDFIMLTITRLKFSEQYKGYDKVVSAMGTLKKTHPTIKYLIVGKYDAEEKARLDKIISETGVKDNVVFTGFIDDAEVAAHFNLADLYIMPSMGEGFGIVFIEALFYGLPVIAGNVDGSVDALAGGTFGILINPLKNKEIEDAILKIHTNKTLYFPSHKNVVKQFGFEAYKTRLRVLLQPIQHSSADLKTAKKTLLEHNHS